MSIKAVVFDLDGVLVDAKDWHYDALNRALNHFGYKISRFDHLITYDGLPTRKKLEMLSLERGLPRELHNFLNELKQVYTLELIYAKCKPVFAHQYALSKLKAEGFKIGVASNSIRKSVDTMMHLTNLDIYFDVMLSNQDVKRAKPDPEMYCKAIQVLGVEPDECLVVEDNDNGVRSATGAGANVLVVETVNEVTYGRIRERIEELGGGPL